MITAEVCVLNIVFNNYSIILLDSFCYNSIAKRVKQYLFDKRIFRKYWDKKITLFAAKIVAAWPGAFVTLTGFFFFFFLICYMNSWSNEAASLMLQKDNKLQSKLQRRHLTMQGF